MKAAIFENAGLQNLNVVRDAKEPTISDHKILIKVKVTCVNPIDNSILSGALPRLAPIPGYSK
jgi:NADPH:quinone reductase-like Zn-dependent oxidoreductase